MGSRCSECEQSKKQNAYTEDIITVMEFNEKLQKLRKQKGLTQEELAEALYVSRTAISKWESGRGYPSIDSLKEIAKFFSVTIDELLSGGEALAIAEEDHKHHASRSRDLVFGLLDVSSAIVFFAPFFGQTAQGNVQSVPLLYLTELPSYLKAAYLAAVTAMTVFGILTLTLQNYSKPLWVQKKGAASVALNAAAAFLFVISSQPYAAVLVLLFLAIKVILLVKQP